LDYNTFLTMNHTNKNELAVRNRFLFQLFLVSCFLFLVSCAQQEPSRTEIALGNTLCTITLFKHGNENIYNEIFNKIREIENLMSVNIPSSDISRINAAAGIESVQVHAEVFKVIERAVYFANVSDGAFDPTVGPLVALWGINTGSENIPSQHKIDEVLPLVNWRNIELDESNTSVFLTQRGMSLDLGAIAKGYAADSAAKIIRDANITRALIDLGGNIIVIGERSANVPWRVGIQKPGHKRGESIVTLQLTDKTIVTSGVYERYFKENGKHYHHLFEPFSGYPADNGLLSVTIVMDVSMDADALSTAVFVLGYERGLVLLESFPEVEAIFIFENMEIRSTNRLN